MGTLAVATFKTLFTIMSCVMGLGILYGLSIDSVSTCFDLRKRWMHLAVADFIVEICLIGAWFAYKESSLIIGVLSPFILFWIGSTGTCGYIAKELSKLSHEECSKDPAYFVIARDQKRGGTGHMRGLSVSTARVIVTLVGGFLVGFSVYTFNVGGSPFRAEVFFPCFIITMLDIYFHHVIFSVWVAYKEPSWISAVFWILLIAIFSSAAMCLYILVQLYSLAPQQPVSLVLFNRNRDLHQE